MSLQTTSICSATVVYMPSRLQVTNVVAFFIYTAKLILFPPIHLYVHSLCAFNRNNMNILKFIGLVSITTCTCYAYTRIKQD